MKQIEPTVNASFKTSRKIDTKIIYHLAGHAASIYLNNKQKQLPAVHFQINIKQLENEQSFKCFNNGRNHGSAIIEGGRLIQSLPLAFAVATRYFTPFQQEQYRCSFEADVVNLLAGALAEAKYVAICDNEHFTPNLLNFEALKFYSGKSDLELIAEYMECYIPRQVDREQKLKELFLESFNFVNKRLHWKAITKLANYIRHENKSIISCEEATAMLKPYSTPVAGHDLFSYPEKNIAPELATA
ncbi:MAG: hypothetical protein IPN42_03285 [Methylococcaceae bacterium]|nr:hypothetical protein [Methylococcaceae bacterium]